MSVKIQFCLDHDNNTSDYALMEPEKACVNDVGYDLTAHAYEKYPGVAGDKLFIVDTCVKVIPPFIGYFLLFSRSSLPKKGFSIANSVGVIDPDYRGNLKTILRFHGKGSGEKEMKELLGSRIVQIALFPRVSIESEVIETVDETERGEGGFGSTGN